jgi:hypothetical protein
LGLFVEHLVGAQKIKGLKTPFKSTQPPAKTAQNQLQTNGSQSKSGFVPKINKKKKCKRMEKFGEMGFREKWGKCGKLGRLVAGGGWKWPVVVRWVVGK